MDTGQNPTDHSRTTQPRAGEWFKNSRDVLGLALLAVGVLAVVGCLAAAAYRHPGWATSMGVVALVGGTVGMVWLLAESRRIRRIEKARLSGTHEKGLDDIGTGPP